MTSVLRLSPGPGRPSRWEVRVPGSKSLTNRLLLLSAVANGRSILKRPLVADDTSVMAAAVATLGADVRTKPEQWAIAGVDGPPVSSAPLDVWCGMAGTAARFLLPMCASGVGVFSFDADAQLRGRPLGALLKSLRLLGATVEPARHAGESLPVTLTASGISGGVIDVGSEVSSQFASGLLMSAPLFAGPSVFVNLPQVSRPYLDMTLQLMRDFGVDVTVRAAGEVAIEPGGYRAREVDVEPDASTASYFLGAGAVLGNTVRIPGLDRRRSTQGDLQMVDVLERMGCVADDGPLELTGPAELRGVHVNMRDATDVFMTVACVAPFASGPTTIEGIGHARGKESDRVAAVADNLARCGIRCEVGQDHITIQPGQVTPGTRIPTYRDHRIAMSFALIGLRCAIEIEEPGVVAKTCPTFFDLLAGTGVSQELVDGD